MKNASLNYDLKFNWTLYDNLLHAKQYPPVVSFSEPSSALAKRPTSAEQGRVLSGDLRDVINQQQPGDSTLLLASDPRSQDPPQFVFRKDISCQNCQ